MREPLFHVVKRELIVWWKAWLIRLGAVLLALVVVEMTAKKPEVFPSDVIVNPTEPVKAQVEPAKAQTEPVEKQMEPAKVQSEPVEKQAENPRRPQNLI